MVVRTLRTHFARALIALLVLSLAACAPQPPAAQPPPTSGQAAAPQPAEATKPAAPGATAAPAAAAKPADAPKPAEAAKPSAPTAAPAAAQPAGNKIVNVGYTFDFRTWDPARSYETGGSMVNYALYDALLLIDEGDSNKPLPMLATEWKIDPNGKVFTFTLRDGVKFASGNPLTSADVKFSFDRLKNLKGQPSFLAANMAEVQVPDPKTVVITLTNVDPAFIGMMGRSTFAVVDSKLARENGATSEPGSDQTDKSEQWFLQNSAGSGPYIMKEYVPKDRVVLERNPNYWGKPPAMDRIVFRAIDDPAAQKLTLEKGDIDIAFDMTADQVKAIDESKGVKVFTALSMTQMFASFNMDPQYGGPLSNPDVQKAVRYAIDYDGIVELVGGGAIKLPGIIQLGFLGALGPDAMPQPDLEMAKQLLTKAGFPGGFKIEHQVGANIKTSGVSHQMLAEKLQTDLARIGIVTTISVMDPVQYGDIYRGGKSTLQTRGWNPDYPDALNQLAFCPGEKVGQGRLNWKVEQAPEIAATCKQAMVELDQNKRAELIKKIQLMMFDNSPFANLVQPGRQIGYRANLEGVRYSPVYQQDFTKLDRK
jgi:peptide/nickel transport system substrate-binding protein